MAGVTQFTVDIKTGAHNLILDPATTAFNMGATQDGMNVHIEPKVVLRKIHRLGDTPYEVRTAGWNITVDAILKARGNLDVFAKVIQGVKTGTGADAVVDLDPRPQALTKYVVALRPVANAAESVDDIVILQASIIPKIAMPIHIEKDQDMAIQIQGLLDETSGGAAGLLRMGKLSVSPTKLRFPQT